MYRNNPFCTAFSVIVEKPYYSGLRLCPINIKKNCGIARQVKFPFTAPHSIKILNSEIRIQSSVPLTVVMVMVTPSGGNVPA